MSHSSDFFIECLVVGQMAENCYIAGSRAGDVVIIDPGDDGQYIIDTVQKLGVIPKAILATHGHFDHIMAAFEVQSTFAIPFFVHTDDRFLVTRMAETAEHFLAIKRSDPPPVISGDIKPGSPITVGPHEIIPMHTPGHTPGSVCFAVKGTSHLFVGDTIFAGGAVGRTDFFYSDHGKLDSSLQTILKLPGDTLLYPGHGNSTRVSDERLFHVAAG